MEVVLKCLCMITGAPNAGTALNCCAPFPKGIPRDAKSAAERLNGSTRESAPSARRRAAAAAAETAPAVRAAAVDDKNSSDQERGRRSSRIE